MKEVQHLNCWKLQPFYFLLQKIGSEIRKLWASNDTDYMFGASQKNSWGQDLLLSRSAGAERVKVLFVTVTTSKNKYKTRTKQYHFQADVKKKKKNAWPLPDVYVFPFLQLQVVFVKSCILLKSYDVFILTITQVVTNRNTCKQIFFKNKQKTM